MKLLAGRNIFEKSQVLEKIKNMRILENVVIPENLKALIPSASTTKSVAIVMSLPSLCI